MNNEDTIKRLETALDHLQEVNAPNGYDSRQLNKATDILEALIKDLTLPKPKIRQVEVPIDRIET